jgi:hypothetical protein
LSRDPKAKRIRLVGVRVEKLSCAEAVEGIQKLSAFGEPGDRGLKPQTWLRGIT